MYEKLESLGLKEILGYAIMSEDVAIEYYKKLANKMHELVAHRLQSIARDEEMHKRILLNLHKQLFNDENYVVPEGLPPFETSEDPNSVSSLISALETAMLNEYQAYRVYKVLGKQHKEQKKLFEYLAMMERGHYESLRLEKEMYEDHVLEDPSLKHDHDHFFEERIQKLF